jgi:MerR family transcriptional regulator, thiopeptide resistance regulator
VPTTRPSRHTVKAAAHIAGVSVRTLHHYDQIGLLKPAAHSSAGYRLYDDRDLQRLQQVLFFKELGFDLKEVKRILSDPSFDHRAALVRHRKLLLERQERLGRLIKAVDHSLAALKKGKPMDTKMFDGFDAAQYEEEARQRWGHTDAWKQSQDRWKKLTKQDLADIQQEGKSVIDGLVALSDESPADPRVQALVARHHRQINDRFYTCPVEILRQLGEAYVDDPRFAAFYDQFQTGLATFLRDAIRVYCDARERS